MTSSFRGSMKVEREEPKPTSVISSRADSWLDSSRGAKGKHSCFQESRGERARTRSEKLTANCCYTPEDEKLEDPDFLYQRSREHFATWDIKDIVGDCNNLTEAKSKNGRKSRFELFRSVPTDSENKLTKVTNGEIRAKVKQERKPTSAKALWSRNQAENDESPSSAKTRFSPIQNANANGNESEDKKKKKKKKNKNKEAREMEDLTEQQRDREKAKSLFLREIENFDSLRRNVNETSAHRLQEKRFKGSRSASRGNETVRSTFEKFKDKRRDSQEDIRSLSLDRTSNRRGYEGSEREAEPCPLLPRKHSEERKNTNRDHRSKESGKSKEVIEIRNESSRKRNDAHSLGPEASKNSRGVERKKSYSLLEGTSPSSLRRSHLHELDNPQEFDIRIQRYERALAGPRRDPETLPRHPSMKTRDSPVNELDAGHTLRKRLPRHARALTPPKEPALEDREDDTRKDWHGSNREFARRYLKERGTFENGALEHHSAAGSAGKELRHKYFGGPLLERNESSAGETQFPRPTGIRQDPLGSFTVLSSDDRYRDASTAGAKRNVTATVIEIPNSSKNLTATTKRWTRGFFGANDDERDVVRTIRQSKGSKKLSRTPSRKIWEYQDGGVKITDIDNGQPCLRCEGSCSGFAPHSWRKNCTSCKCPREAHDVCHEEWVSVRARLGLKADSSGGPVPFDPKDRGLVWAPPGLPSHKVEEYFSLLPEIMVPRLGSPGERYRDRQLAIQLPKQDLARAYCRHLEPQHSTSADDFMAARNEIALDIGTVQEIAERGLECGGCHNPLHYGTLAVSASKLGLLYHPPCFQCTQCRELLVDLAYCVHDDALYCERHYAEQLKPRCAACDESETMADVDSVVYTTTERKVRKVKKTTKRRESHDQNAEVTITEVDSTQNNHNAIEDGEYTKAMNKDWHSGHFCCWQCDESLTGQRYVLRDEHPYCIKCYESVFANGCEECNKIIGIDSKDLSYKDKHWHEACFLCNKCRVSLVDKQFGSKVDKIYCGNCYDAQFASRCDGCGEIFRAGTKKMEYKTRQWHEKCFCCVVCKNPIGTKSFIPREQEIYCAGCYEDKFATRCVKCNKIITSGGVTYKNEPWHRDCFTCSNCSTSLAGQRFTSRDEKPYCADCFGELFAKRCTACTKPITGIGGTRFISFEDRHWHNDCFICAGCRTSLVGRGFITDGDDIICPECAKQKLM